MMAGVSCSGFLQAARSAEAVCNSPRPPLTSVVQREWPASIRPPCGACTLEMSWSPCVCACVVGVSSADYVVTEGDVTGDDISLVVYKRTALKPC